MEEVLHLDGVQFADESVMGVVDEGDVGAGSAVEGMEYMEDHHIMMDTGADEIVGLGLEGEYEVGGTDMPALGGEEEVLTLHSTLPSHSEYYTPALGDIVTTTSHLYQHTQLPTTSDGMEVEQLMAECAAEPAAASSLAEPVKQEYVTFSTAQLQPRAVTLAQPAPRSVQMAPSVRSCGVREVAIAPKPASMRTEGAGKPWTQAAKLVPIGKGGVVKKLAIGSLVQGKASTVIGQLGKQLVMVGAGETGGATAAGGARIKLVPSSAAATSAGGTIHYIKTKPSQTVMFPADKTGGATNPILTKMLVHAGPGGAGDAQTVLAKIVPAAGGSGGGGAPRYITLQQHVQAGGAGGARAAPGKPVLRVKPRTQHIISLKAPPKLVPVTAHGVAVGGAVSTATSGTTNKVVLTGGAAQRVVLKAGGGGGTRIHQINVPGKGVQYIRLVTPPSQAGAGAGKPVSVSVSAGRTAAAPTIITLPSSKTLLLPDSHVSKQQQNMLVRIAPVSKHQQTLLAATTSGRSATRAAQSLLAPLSSARAAPVAAPAPAAPTPVKMEEEDSKVSLQELVADMNMNDQHQLPIEYDGPKSVPEAEEQEGEGQEEEEEDGAGEEVYSRGEGGGVDPAHDYGTILHATYMQMHKEKMEADVLLQSGHGAYTPAPAHQSFSDSNGAEMELRTRKACNCTKSQCLKLYCDCFANGEFCHQCNCTNCHNNLDNEELRQKAIRSCLDRNPNAFRPKIGKGKSAVGPEPVRIHNKGCNCKRSGCLKNYCECYEAKIACSSICRCVGCRNVEDSAERGRHRDGSWSAADELPPLASLATLRPPPLSPHTKQPCSFMTTEVIEAVCQCLLAAGAAAAAGAEAAAADAREADEARVPAVLGEFSRCLQDIIGAARHAQPGAMQA